MNLADFEIKGAFGGLDLENIKLLWQDEQAGSEFRIVDLDISTGRIVPNEAFPMTLHLDASASGDLDIIFRYQGQRGIPDRATTTGAYATWRSS